MNERSSTDSPNPLLDLQPGGATFRDRVINPLMFRAYMLAKMPVLGVTGSYLEDIGTRRCEAVLPYGWTTKNLFGHLFSSAALAAAETASSALLVLHIRNQDADLSPQLTHLEADFDRSVEQQLHLRCEDGARYADFVHRANGGPLPTDETFEIIVETERGDRVGTIRPTWELEAK